MKKYLMIIFLAALCYFVVGIIRTLHNEPIYATICAAVVGYVLMVGLSYFSLKYFKELNAFLTILLIWLGISAIELPGIIISDTIYYNLLAYLFMCLGIVCGYCLWRVKRTLKIVVLGLSIAILSLIPYLIKMWYVTMIDCSKIN